MRRWPIALVLFALTAGACSASDLGPVEREAAPTQTTDTTDTTDAAEEPVDEPEPEATIDWQPCGAAECATVAAPLDYDDPDGETIDIHVSRVPASGERLGALWLNFGGPGGTAADTITFWPVPAEISEHFDIVGMDPRGVGESSPLDCGLPADELYHPDPTIEDQADEDALLEVSERYVADCQAAKGDVLPHVGTRNVARDMDLIREAMGDEQLNFLGYSYGTSIGQAYAELFGDRVRAMILDGIVDPAPPGIEVATTQAAGFETALAAWAADCEARGCPLADPLAAIDQVLEQAETGIPSSDGRTLGPGEASTALAYPLYSDVLWSQLDRAVEQALAGDGSGMLSLADSYLGLADFSIYFAVNCLDSTWPTDTQAFMDQAKAAETVAPRFGEAIVNDYIRCALWPTPPDPIGAPTAPDAPPILVVSTTGDPATPYENGVVVADRLTSGVLLTHNGEGHGIVFQGNGCIDDIAVDYLVDLATPDDGAAC